MVRNNMIKLIRFIVIVAVIILTLYTSIVIRIINPDMTEMRLFLTYWPEIVTDVTLMLLLIAIGDMK